MLSRLVPCDPSNSVGWALPLPVCWDLKWKTWGDGCSKESEWGKYACTLRPPGVHFHGGRGGKGQELCWRLLTSCHGRSNWVWYLELRQSLSPVLPCHPLLNFHLFSLPFSQKLLYPRWLMTSLKLNPRDRFKLFYDYQAALNSTDLYLLESSLPLSFHDSMSHWCGIPLVTSMVPYIPMFPECLS